MDIHPTSVIAFLSVFFVYVGIIGFRSRIIFRLLYENVPVIHACEGVLITSAVNLVSPFRFAGVIVKPYFFKKTHGVKYEKTLSVVFIEQIFDVISQFLIILLCLYLISSELAGIDVEFSVYQLLLLLFAFFILFLLFYERRFVSLIERVLMLVNYLPDRIGNFIKRKSPIRHKNIINAIEKIQSSEKKGIYILSISMTTILISLVLPLIQYFYFRSIGIEITYLQIFIVHWLPFFVGRVSGVPGGMGVREASMIAILAGYGMGVGSAAFATISFRIVISMMLTVLGLFVAGKYKIKISQLKRRTQ